MIARSYKLVVIGDAESGKSSLLFRFIHRHHNSNLDSTVMASFHSKILPNGQRVNMWDTAGQERYRSMLHMYLKNINLVLYVYDVTKESSFNHLKEYWVDWTKKTATIDPVMLQYNNQQAEHYYDEPQIAGILVGNKTDLVNERVIATEMGQKFADELGIPFIETSVKKGTNVDKVWSTVAQELLGNIPVNEKISGGVSKFDGIIDLKLEQEISDHEAAGCYSKCEIM